MVIVILRNPTSYFRTYRNHFIAIYAAFNGFPVREITVILNLPDPIILASTQIMVAAAAVIAFLWAHLATRLYLYPNPASLKVILEKPRRPIHLIFLLYLIPLITMVASAILIPGSIEAGKSARYLVSGIEAPSVGYSPGFLLAASTVTVSFVSYPLLVLVRLRSQLKDPEVRYALKLIASSFGVISAILLVSNGLGSFGVSLIAPAHAVSVSLLIVVVYAFSRPSFLKAFLGVVPSLNVVSSARRSDQSVLIYKSDEEKYGPMSKYVSEGVNQGGRVIYYYDGREATIREKLAQHGLDIRQHTTKGNLRLFPLESLYQSAGLTDEEAAIDSVRELTEETKTLGKEGVRIVIDYGEHTRRPSQQFVRHLTDPRWTGPEHFVKILMAFAQQAFEGQGNALAQLKSEIPTIELSESIDTFSRTIGLSHSEIAGKKILLEYEPQSNYDRVLQALLAESASNFERTVLFTRRESPIQPLIRETPGLKIFLITPRVSYLKAEKENVVLLPAYDTSLLLDALNKTIEAYAGASFTIIFDNISHYVFTLGHNRALALVRQALELIVSNRITAVFLLNIGAHENMTVASFENLFDIELVCKAGARIPEVKTQLMLRA